MAKAKRTTASLRDILFDEIDAVRSAEGDPLRARAVALLSREIVATARLEMQFAETQSRLEEKAAAASISPLRLGAI